MTPRKLSKKEKELSDKLWKDTISNMRIDGFTYSDGVVKFKGQPIDVSATKPEPLSIAYTTLKQINYE